MWFGFRALSKLGSERKVVSLEEVVQMDGQMDVPIKDQEEIVLFLRYTRASIHEET